MTARVPLPSVKTVLSMREQLTENSSNGAITVKSLAEAVGLTNPTFWRYFREIAEEVSSARRTNLQRTVASGKPTTEHSNLRRENDQLRTRLVLAAAQVQLLSVENTRLQALLSSQENVLKFPTQQ